jgi:hypothetical protein
MKSPRSLITACFLFFLFAFNTAAQTNKITAAEAKDHIGETRTVCGKVVSTHYASGSKGQPTFLNLDEPYPKEVFTILIWGSDRAQVRCDRDEIQGCEGVRDRRDSSLCYVRGVPDTPCQDIY